ncbi:hypothetical protein CMV_000675 [Castanea mollissima]|uniref:Uncharacterized protein n=1 Tax=Castanea mollissima TaxID=60419 RepID=A0A8J4W7A8_9ROSI|nr:hypothetical protein CMV_000675 [Castanea mollissima]
MNIDHTNGGGRGGGGGLYDDVYCEPPRFGVAATLLPRAEDYNEIFESFHASHATSIPVQDLPVVDEEGSKVFFNVRSSDFDYSKVFGGGGGGGLDFVVSYEDLLFDLSEEDEEAWYDECSKLLDLN